MEKRAKVLASLLLYVNNRSGYFEDQAYHDEIHSLFQARCPMCNSGFKSLDQLSQHVKTAHKLQYWYYLRPASISKINSQTCLNHHKVFLNEKVLYTPELLEKHKREGDKLLNIKPHPVCAYCKTMFFSEEELYIHCKEKHETCFICDRFVGH